MLRLLLIALIMLCSGDVLAQCFWDVRYITCPTPPSVTRGYTPVFPLYEQQRPAPNLLSDTLLLDYWIKRSRNPR